MDETIGFGLYQSYVKRGECWTCVCVLSCHGVGSE